MRLSLATAVLSLVVSTAALAFELKGIAINSPATPEQIFKAFGVKCGVGSGGMQICNGTVTIAQETAYMNLVISEKGIVQRIVLLLEPSSFDVIAPLLIEKFGQPTKTDRKDIQNRMGAHFEQVSHFWRASDETEVYYSKYAGPFDSSVLSFTTKEDRKLTHNTIEDRRQDL